MTDKQAAAYSPVGWETLFPMTAVWTRLYGDAVEVWFSAWEQAGRACADMASAQTRLCTDMIANGLRAGGQAALLAPMELATVAAQEAELTDAFRRTVEFLDGRPAFSPLPD
jgi:hypothetical protein